MLPAGGMKLALAIVVVVGIGIGVSFPSPSPVPAAAAPAEAAIEDAPRETVLERRPDGHFYATAEVNGQPVRFLVDTGASTIALTEADAKRARIPFDPGRYVPVGRGATSVVTGQDITVNSIVIDGKRGERLRGVVMEGAEQSLLGQNYLRRLSVVINGDTMTLRPGA